MCYRLIGEGVERDDAKDTARMRSTAVPRMLEFADDGAANAGANNADAGASVMLV